MRARGRALALGAAATGALVVAAVLAATQLRREEGVVAVAPSDVPFALLEDEAPSVRKLPSADEQLAPVFLVYEGALVPVLRPVPRVDPGLALGEALVRGPTDDEAARGLVTRLVPDAEPSRVRIDGDLAVVDLREPLSTGVRGDGRLAIAQLVHTLTALRGVDAVRFELDGEPAEVPVGDGTLTRSAVTRADFPVQVLAVPP